jgi:hypothetical protein
MNRDERVQEVWFPGVHSDIGGGYKRAGLSDNSLSFMIERAKAEGIHFIEAQAIDFAEISEEADAKIEIDDVEVKPDALAFLHHRERDEKVASKTLTPRKVFVSVNDEESEHLPVLHHSVVDRFQNRANTNYQPSNLKNVRHLVLGPDGQLTEHAGLDAHSGSV